MSPFVADLLVKYGIPTSSRSCYLSVLWNGKDLALNTTREDEEGDPLEVVPLSDFDLLHEIAHYVVASPVEREFPEFGMGIAFIHGAAGWDWSRLKGRERELAEESSKGVLTKEEANFREYAADFLGCYWATQMGMEVPANYWPHVKYADERAGEVYRALLWVVGEGLVQVGCNGVGGR